MLYMFLWLALYKVNTLYIFLRLNRKVFLSPSVKNYIAMKNITEPIAKAWNELV
jgi:hypothetical protein